MNGDAGSCDPPANTALVGDPKPTISNLGNVKSPKSVALPVVEIVT